jgi:hypothetical protein
MSHVNNPDIISRPEPENAVIDPAPSYPSFSLAPREVPVNTLLDDNFFLNDNLFAFDDSLTPNLGPVEWYDLLAEDAINSMQGQSSRWDFDITTLSRRQSPRQSVAPETVGTSFDGLEAQPLPVLHKHWNTESALELTQDEAVYYRHFIDVVAPVLDLFDHERHFANIVPHLALRNVGLLKSILAVGACHMTIVHHPSELGEAASFLPGTPASGASATTNTRRIAGQYYYETLQYLSQHLLYQAYTTSHELLSTAVMISIYEVSSYPFNGGNMLKLRLRCSARSTTPIIVTGIGICVVLSGFRRIAVLVASLRIAYIAQYGGRGSVKMYGPLSVPVGRLLQYTNHVHPSQL